MEPSPFQDLAYILKTELPSLKGNLTENILNLSKVADFCEDNYLNSSNDNYPFPSVSNSFKDAVVKNLVMILDLY